MNVFFLLDKNFIYSKLKVRLYIPMIEITVFSNQGLNRSLEWSLHLEDGKENGQFPPVYVSRT